MRVTKTVSYYWADIIYPYIHKWIFSTFLYFLGILTILMQNAEKNVIVQHFMFISINPL